MASADPFSLALESLLSRCERLVGSVAYRHGLADHEFDELKQAVRLRLWHARGTSEQIGGTPASYVYRTAITAALDLIRARRGREESIDEAQRGAEPATSSRDSADTKVEADELAAQIAAAVELVTPTRRPVLKMYLAGYDRTEIAELMGWSEAKTRNLLYRGLADLRALLEAKGIGVREDR